MKHLVIKNTLASSFSIAALLIAMLGVSSVPAYAVPIVFNLGYGGTVSYSGGATQLITQGGVVEEVTNGVTSASLTDVYINFETGGYLGGAGDASAFDNYYAAGGGFKIGQDLGTGTESLLLAGSFGDTSIFHYASGSSSFGGLLDISYVDSGLAALLGFNLPPTGGSIAQVHIYFYPTQSVSVVEPNGPGSSFVGVQGGGAVTVTDVPEPATLLLLGSGLLVLGAVLRKKKLEQNT